VLRLNLSSGPVVPHKRPAKTGRLRALPSTLPSTNAGPIDACRAASSLEDTVIYTISLS